MLELKQGVQSLRQNTGKERNGTSRKKNGKSRSYRLWVLLSLVLVAEVLLVVPVPSLIHSWSLGVFLVIPAGSAALPALMAYRDLDNWKTVWGPLLTEPCWAWWLLLQIPHDAGVVTVARDYFVIADVLLFGIVTPFLCSQYWMGSWSASTPSLGLILQ